MIFLLNALINIVDEMAYNTRSSAAKRRPRIQVTLPDIELDENDLNSCPCVEHFHDVPQNYTVFPKLTRNHLITASVLFCILIFLFAIFSDPQKKTIVEMNERVEKLESFVEKFKFKNARCNQVRPSLVDEKNQPKSNWIGKII